jgi:hypothetical protein
VPCADNLERFVPAPDVLQRGRSHVEARRSTLRSRSIGWLHTDGLEAGCHGCCNEGPAGGANLEEPPSLRVMRNPIDSPLSFEASLGIVTVIVVHATLGVGVLVEISPCVACRFV